MFKTRLKKIVRDNANRDYPKKLDITAPTTGIAMINSACGYNAVHAVKSGMAVGVIEVVVVDDDSCSAHYVSLMTNGDIVDFTLGWSWAGADYRLVRYVHPDEYGKINECLSNLKSQLCYGLPWYFGVSPLTKWDLC